MPVDAPAVAQISRELNNYLPVRIAQIFQPYPEEFLFCGYGSGEDFKLLISLDARYGRFHLFEGFKDCSSVPTPFGTLLRKHFSGSKLIAFCAVPFERITKLTFEVYEAATGLTKKEIRLELTGKRANLIITDSDGIIIDAWRKNTDPKPGEREVSPGSRYELPGTGGRWKPVTVSYQQFRALFDQLPPDVTLERFLLKHWYGMSPLSIQEITRRAGWPPSTQVREFPSETLPELFASFTDWAEKVAAGNFEPTVLYDPEGKAIDCSALKIAFPPENTTAKQVPELNKTVAAIFDQLHESSRFQELKQNLLRKINSHLEKDRAKLAKQEAEAAAAEAGDRFRIAGELLMTYGYQISKGSSQVKLINHYDPAGAELLIDLNPALTPQANAQAYFKKYQKAKKGQQAIAAQIVKTKEAIEYLESIETLAQNALITADLRLVREELEQNEKRPSGSGKASKRSGKKETPAEPRQYKTPAGHTILVGRNNLQNDRLTLKIADPADWWFHTQKIPGSHVILRQKPGVPVDDDSLNRACQLAVYFSKARQSTKVPVDYTQRKNVKKPPAANPGFVIYDFFKTAIVTPDAKILAELGVLGKTE